MIASISETLEAVDMVDLADVFRQYGPAYREKYGDKMLPSQRQAMADIEQCRTAGAGCSCLSL